MARPNPAPAARPSLTPAQLAAQLKALFDRLNPQQRAAVEGPAESLLVLAGAGSGKTGVLTARIARLIAVEGLKPSEVMAVTFTNKAAREMRERLLGVLDRRVVSRIAVGTFHSLCARMLRDHHQAAGLPKNFAILDVDGQVSLCTDILKDLVLSKPAVKDSLKQGSPSAKTEEEGEDTSEDDDVREEIAGHAFLTPKEAVRYISGQKEALKLPKPLASEVTWRSPMEDQVEAVFAEYRRRLERGGQVDFQDLLTRSVDLLRSAGPVRDSYHASLRCVLVDEFQDTNDLQYDWLKLIAGPNASMMAVGDDSQSIYAFRSARPENMNRFVAEMTATKDRPDGRVVKLEENYRSKPFILDAANAIIANNPTQLKKRLFSSQPDYGERIDLHVHESGIAEAKYIATSIHSAIANGAQPSDFAVVYRGNVQSRVIESELNKLAVPCSVFGGFKFFQRAEIKSVLAYLDLVADLDADLAFTRVANFPPRRLTGRTIEDLRQEAQLLQISMMETVARRQAQIACGERESGTASARAKQAAMEGFCHLILDLVEYAETHSLSDLIREILHRAGVTKHYQDEAESSKGSSEESAERLNNIGELVSAARQFELDSPHLAFASQQLPEYLDQVALMTSTSETDVAARNTVSLMTLHSSKGLEFDVVHIAGLDEGALPHSKSIKDDEIALALGKPATAVQEERRLMYVGVTRARKELYLHTADIRLTNGSFVPCSPSRFIDEIPTHRLNVIESAVAQTPPVRARTQQTGKREEARRQHRDGGREESAPHEAFLQGQREQSPPLPALSSTASFETSTQLESDAGDRRVAASKPWLARGHAPRLPLAGSESLDHTRDRAIAIVGAAGADRSDPLTPAVWGLALADAGRRVRLDDTLIAGGAPWMEHLAVHLFLEGKVRGLTLHLPAPFESGRFVGPERSSGAAANAFHDRFSQAIGFDSLLDISRAIARGARVTAQPAAAGYDGLVSRSRRVATDATGVLAYTFADGNAPAGGGASETWDLVLGPRVHIPLGRLAAVTSVALPPFAYDRRSPFDEPVNADRTAHRLRAG